MLDLHIYGDALRRCPIWVSPGAWSNEYVTRSLDDQYRLYTRFRAAGYEAKMIEIARLVRGEKLISVWRDEPFAYRYWLEELVRV